MSATHDVPEPAIEMHDQIDPEMLVNAQSIQDWRQVVRNMKIADTLLFGKDCKIADTLLLRRLQKIADTLLFEIARLPRLQTPYFSRYFSRRHSKLSMEC